MTFRLTCFLFCVSIFASCKDEKQVNQTSNTPDLSGVPSEFTNDHQIQEKAVFPEEALNSWGYQTSEIEDQSHSIRSKKNYGDSETAFYARFWLAKALYKTQAEASKEKKRIESLLDTGAGFKNYTQIIQQDNVLYSIRATSNYTFLSHQPKLASEVRSHLAN